MSITIEWQATAPIRRDFTAFVHLVGPDGTIVSQVDSQPTWVVAWPTSRWIPGQPVLDSHRILLPPDLTPGHYQVRAGLYYLETLERLSVLDESRQPISDHVILGEIQIEP